MEEKKVTLLKCWVRAFCTYAVLSFGWTAILSFGTALAASTAKAVSDTSVDSSGISEFAKRLVYANGAFAVFAVVFGFSFLLFKAKNMSSPAKRSLHIIVNYVAAVVCAYIIHSTSSASTTATGWVSMVVIWTFVFFIIYGISMLVSFAVRRKRENA